MNDPAAGRRIGLEALDAELARLDRLLEREIVRLRARYELSLDEFRGLYISDRQVDDLLASHGNGASDLRGFERPEGSPAGPLRRLANVLGLDTDACDLVVMALAPECDPKYQALYAYLNNDVARRHPTLELAARVYGTSRAHTLALREALAPDSRLVAHGAVEFARGADAIRAQRGFRLSPPLADWLLGLPWCDERLIDVTTVEFQHASEALPLLAPATAREIEQAAARLEDGEPLPVFLFTGSTHGEALLAAKALYAVAGRPALTLDLTRVLTAPDPAAAIGACELMQRVLGLGLVAAPLDALLDAEQRPIASIAAPLRRLCGRSPAVALAASAGFPRHALAADLRVLPITCHELATADRARIWRGAVGTAPSPATIDALADRFELGADRIMHAAQAASDAARFCRGGVTLERHYYDAARATSSDGAVGVTREPPTAFGWDDLIVPTDLRRRLRDLVRAVELRPRVLDQWGFGRRLGGARGIKVLFAGASGTGKTMAVAIIASTLGVDLHRIDLAATVSKYIGETEKNLERAFAAARRANAILFIDEADALLGKRSEVKDAHDRYANVEVAYLLQRMESYDGVVILATNLAQNIDEAFSRRMHFVIEFPLPDTAGREALWRSMIPPEAPLAADVDFGFLARRFPLAGGDIRNIVLDAAYRAAQANEALGMAHLLHAVASQFAKRGKVPAAGEFREYAGLLERELVAADALAGGAAARSAA